MTREEVKRGLLDLALDCYKKGPGFAQEGYVLRLAKNKFGVTGVPQQQAILDCWHQLFRDGQLVWGYDLDNPSSPFYHAPAA